MIQRALLRHWCSATKPSRFVAELRRSSSPGYELGNSIETCATELLHAEFLIVSIDGVPGVTAEAIGSAVRVLRSAGSHARLCLAGRRGELQGIHEAGFVGGDIGFMLDLVDDGTSPVELLWDGLEAVRFSPEFLSAAHRSFRSGCALAALLGLAKNLGLCTLGETSVPNREMDSCGDFDYLAQSNRILNVSASVRTEVQPAARRDAAVTR